ncbi:MAG: YraN family protein [Candidatus Pacebacteria bacterium]|nr:YraN family protein [Candidatus Paceibacterota bacterium]
MAEPQHISIGRIGENIIWGYLKNRGYLILDRNYRKKWGELDIIAQKDNVLHFIEVKAGSWRGDEWPRDGADIHRPEDHMHAHKRARMARAVQTYLAEKSVKPDAKWTVDLAVVLINKETRKARVRWIWDLLLE